MFFCRAQKPMLLVLLCLVCSAKAVGKQINFVWNLYCPYTCVEKGVPGYAMEIVKTVYKGSKYKVNFKFVDSWNRAMNQVKSGKYDAIVFSFHVNDVDEYFVYPEQHLAIERGNSFMVLADNKVKLTDVTSLNYFSNIGVYKNTVWADDKLATWERMNRQKFTYLHGGNVFDRALKMLRMRRIDAWEDSWGLLSYNIYKNKIADVRIERILSDSTSDGGVLFSKKNAFSREYAVFFNDRVKAMRRSGQFDEILSKYGQTDFYGR